MTMKQRILIAFAAASLATAPAFADTFTLTLSPSTTTLSAGGTYSFMGTIAADASNGGDLTLISESATGDSPLALDEDPFYSDTPLFLSPGEFYKGALFTASLPASAMSGTYLGNLDVQVTDAQGNPLFQDAAFSVVAAPAAAVTPEPGSWLLLATGLAAAGCFWRRSAARAA